MPPKKVSKGDKEASSPKRLIPPATFSASMTMLGILPRIPPTRTQTRKRQRGEMSDNPETTTNTSTWASSTPKGEINSSVVFTNGALELLRKCHGEFISLLGDGIVSSKEKSSSVSFADKKQNRPKKEMCENGCGNSDEEKNGQDTTISQEEERKVRKMIVTPKSISESLHAMEFTEIASHVMELECQSSSREKELKSPSGKQGHEESMTLAEKRKHLKLKRQRMKKAFQNKELSNDLLKEQERLFASSAAKAKTKP